MSVLFQHRRGLCAQYGRDEGRLQMEAPGSGKMHPAFRRRGDGKTILHSLQVDVCWLLRLLDEFAPGEQQQDGLRICIHFESLNLFIPMPGSGFALQVMALLRQKGVSKLIIHGHERRII